MAISLIKGPPGAGKSYECVVYHVIPALKERRKVVTNIPLNIEHFKKIMGDDIEELIDVHPFDFESGGHGKRPSLQHPDDYIKYQEWRNEKGQGCLFILDECHFIFPLNGRGKAQTDLAERQVEFFSGHRHYGFDFIFLTQSDKKINRLIREDIELCFQVRKNRAMGDSSYIRYLFYYGEGRRNGLLDQDTRKYEKKYFSFYKSHTKSDGEVQEAQVKDVKKWHQNWTVRLGVIVLLAGIISTANILSRMFGSSEPESIEKTQAVQVAVKAAPVIEKKQDTSRPKKSNNFEGLPFGEFKMHISGYSDSSYTDDNGIYHIQKQVYFTAVNSAKFELSLRLEDLYLAGYQVSVYGPCMVRLTYGDVTKLLYCRGTKPEHKNISGQVSELVSL